MIVTLAHSPLPAIKITGVLLMVILFLYAQLSIYPNVFLVLALSVFILIVFQLNRKDRTILAMIYNKPFLAIWMEYIVLSLPLMAIIAFSNYYFVLFPIFASFSAAFLPGRRKKKQAAKYSVLKYFGNSFEWAAGMRKNYLVIGFLILFAFIFITKPYIPFLFYLFILTICCGFYSRHEPLQLLFIQKKRPLSFLIAKWKEACINFYKISLPFCILYTVFNFESGWISLYFILLTGIAFAYFIASKYAYYVPNETNAGNQILQLVFAVGIIVPFFLPVTLLMLIYFFIQAKKNLHQYLHAYN
jgi:hypothetical protein